MGVLFFKFATVAVVGSRLDPGVPFSTGWWAGTPGVSTDQDLIDNINNITPYSNDTNPFSGNLTFELDQNTPIFQLDGGSFLSFNNLPAGFMIESANITFLGNNIDTPLYGTVQGIITGTTLANYNSGAAVTSFNSGSIDLCQGVAKTPLAFLALNVKIIFNYPPAQPPGNFHNAAYHFNIVSATYSSPNSPITITGSGGFKLAGAGYNIYYFVGGDSLDGNIGALISGAATVESNEFISGDGTSIDLEASSGTGVQFNGSFPFMSTIITGSGGILVSNTGADENNLVLSTDVSGLYILVPGKTNDTIYDRNDPLNITTTVVKIPDPYIRTAFLGG